MNILYYLRLGSTVFPLSLVLSVGKGPNHVLVFSICALSKLIVVFFFVLFCFFFLIVVFVCKVFLHYTPLSRF